MTLDLMNRIQLCRHCRHIQEAGYACERCGQGTMRINKQMARALQITADHEEMTRHGVALPDMRAPRAQ